jgi:hypothetical protein
MTTKSDCVRRYVENLDEDTLRTTLGSLMLLHKIGKQEDLNNMMVFLNKQAQEFDISYPEVKQ